MKDPETIVGIFGCLMLLLSVFLVGFIIGHTNASQTRVAPTYVWGPTNALAPPSRAGNQVLFKDGFLTCWIYKVDGTPVLWSDKFKVGERRAYCE